MAYRVYRVPGAMRARLERALGDDILSRQSLTMRDARRLGERDDAVYVFVEGTEAGMLRADAVMLEFAERAPAAAELLARLREEEDAAASGLGRIFDA